MNHNEKTLTFNDVLGSYASFKQHHDKMIDMLADESDDETQIMNLGYQLDGMAMIVRSLYGKAYAGAEIDSDELDEMADALNE